jgi:ribonucleoside-diphosphate reductase alpha chain
MDKSLTAQNDKSFKPMPVPADLPQDIHLTENARVVLEKRYLRKGPDGQPAESIPEMFWRVAYHVALAEKDLGGSEAQVMVWARQYYHLLTRLEFFPNSPTFTGAGTPLGQLAACFTAQTRISTDQGSKPISELVVGDKVLTHEGRYRRVTELHRRAYQGELLKVKVKLLGTALEVTPEHPILTPEGWVRAGDLQVGTWVAVGVHKGVHPNPVFDLAQSVFADELEMQLEGDLIRVRRPSNYQNSGRQAQWVNRFIEITPDFARLCGYFISEGTMGIDERYIRFTFNKEETAYHEDVTELLKRYFNVSVTQKDSNFGNWTQIDVYSRAIAEWFKEQFGGKATTKHLPAWLMYADHETQHEFLVGVMRGDGLFFQKTYKFPSSKYPQVVRTTRLTLANPSLIQQIWQLSLRLGYEVAIRPVDTTYVTPTASPTAQISFSPLKSKELVKRAFGVELEAPKVKNSRKHLKHEEDNIYFQVEKIDRQDFEGTVYNCEVDEDHTYVAEGLVVHNCFVLDIDDDMGRTGTGIFETLRNAALIQQTGGGNGFAFSRLRPKGALVKSSNGAATGPVGFLKVYDQAFGEIAQGGCLTPDTLIFTSAGLLRLDEIVQHSEPGWLPHEYQVSTDEGMRPSYQGYNNGVAPVLRISTEAGIQLTGTYEHKLKVMTGEGPVWKRFDELQVGDSLMALLGQHQGEMQYLQAPKSHHGNQNMPYFPEVLEEDLAFLIGYLMGDGFVAKGEDDHRVGFSVAHTSYMIEALPELIASLFGDHIKIHKQQKSNDASLVYLVDNVGLKSFLLMNGLHKKSSSEAEVPLLIRKSPPAIVGAFLRGLFEADGSTIHGYPQLVSTSEVLIRQVATLLIGLGCTIKVHETKIAENSGHFGKRPIWYLRIQSFQSLLAWKTNIGCDPRSRFAVCLNFEPNLDYEISYELPNPDYWLNPVLEAITLPQKDRRGRGKGLKMQASQPELRRSLLRYTRGDRQLTLSAYTRLSQDYAEFADHARPVGSFWFTPITAIEPAGMAPTFDIEVEGNHTYQANGLLSHNSRRGANMAVLRVDHPDIREFIQCKGQEGHIENFNISVGITDAFMQAVEADTTYDLINPQDGAVWETIPAREVFDLIVEYAYRNGEPGVLFLDAANRENPVPHLYTLESTNPCGEQFLGGFENCCLGSINLAQHLSPDGRVDWKKLQASVELSTRFLDHVVTANKYVPAIPELRQAAERVRRIGLGIMGLADMMYVLGVRYGSEEGQEFASQIMEFVRYHSMKTSIALAKDHGPFLAIQGSRYDPADLKWTIPQSIVPHKSDWGRPALNWEKIEKNLRKHGIRNGCQLTVAPTGTISTVSGCEGYGCEPVFALAYLRYVVNNAGNSNDRTALQYTSPLFQQALERSGLSTEAIQAIIEQVNQTGTCQHISELPEPIRRVFVVAGDVTAEEHIRMQAALQAWTDNAISKTANFSSIATKDDVAKAYHLGWKLGCKGLTVYVTGSRDKVVLETKETLEKKQKAEAALVEEAPAAVHTEQPMLFNESKKPRPHQLAGRTYRMETPAGTTFITLNENGYGEGQPFEVFINTAKAGSEIMAISEAMGRLISYTLRLSSPVSPRARLKELVRQLEGIGGDRSLGFGMNRVRSLPDGVSQILEEYLESTPDEPAGGLKVQAKAYQAALLPSSPAASPAPTRPALGDICPACGQASLVNEEGCRKCYNCSHSEC